MLSQQQRIAIAAREIRLHRCEPLVWCRAQRLAEQHKISPRLAYTRLRSQQIACKDAETECAANDDFIMTGVFPQATDEIEAALRLRARRGLVDILLVLLTLGCVALVWMHLAGIL